MNLSRRNLFAALVGGLAAACSGRKDNSPEAVMEEIEPENPQPNRPYSIPVFLDENAQWADNGTLYFCGSGNDNSCYMMCDVKASIPAGWKQIPRTSGTQSRGVVYKYDGLYRAYTP